MASVAQGTGGIPAAHKRAADAKAEGEGEAAAKAPRCASKMPESSSLATLAVHGGELHDPGHGAIFPPITTATSFVRPSLDEEGRFGYARCGNPTRHAYETALAALEGGTFCTATASGMAATALALELLPHGSHVIVMHGVYGGTIRLFEKVRKHSMGLETTFTDLNDVREVCKCIRSNTRMIWVETPTNPLLNLVDVPALAAAVAAHQPNKQSSGLLSDRILLCADNTFATAWNQKPLALGVDLVMLSTSKYIGGHSDMIGGALITKDPAVAERLNLLKTSVGAVASPFDAYLALRGLKTLAIRMERQCANALHVATFLQEHARIAEVHYPGLPSHPDHQLCKRQMRTGGAVVTVRLKSGDGDDIGMMRRFFSRLRYWVLAESLGGVESMINHSATMSHGSLTQEERRSMGIYDTTLRLSVGIEDADDIVNDLRFALAD